MAVADLDSADLFGRLAVAALVVRARALVAHQAASVVL
jgi:hypothetical protein